MESIIAKWLKRRKDRKFVKRVLLWKHFLQDIRSDIFQMMKMQPQRDFQHVFDLAWIPRLHDRDWSDLPLDSYKSHVYQWTAQEYAKDRDKVKKIASLHTRLERIKKQYGLSEKDRIKLYVNEAGGTVGDGMALEQEIRTRKKVGESYD